MVAESSGNTKQLQVLLHTCDLHYLKQLLSGSPPCSDHFPIFSYCKWGISIKTWWLWWDLPVQRPFAPPLRLIEESQVQHALPHIILFHLTPKRWELGTSWDMRWSNSPSELGARSLPTVISSVFVCEKHVQFLNARNPVRNTIMPFQEDVWMDLWSIRFPSPAWNILKRHHPWICQLVTTQHRCQRFGGTLICSSLARALLSQQITFAAFFLVLAPVGLTSDFGTIVHFFLLVKFW